MSFPEPDDPRASPPPWPELSAPPPPEFQQGWPAPGFYPLTIGRTVSLAFSLFRFGWRTFVGIALLAAIPVAVFQALASVSTYQAITDWQQQLLDSVRTSPFTPSAPASVTLSGFPVQALGLTFVVSLILGAVTTVAGAALIRAITAAISGSHMSVRDAYRAAFGRLKDLLVMYVLVTSVGLGVGLLVLLGPALSLGTAGLLGNGGGLAFLALLAAVAIVFVSIFLAVRFSLSVQALMVENLSAMAALRRSYRLVAGSMWRLVGYVLMFSLILALLNIIPAVVSFILTLFIAPPFSLTAGVAALKPTALVVQNVITGFFAQIFAPIMQIGLIFLYLDIRWRHGETVPMPGGVETTGPQPVFRG
jgi:hypothetical protein